MSYLKVTQFDKHQHYKNRKPPWIKFHVKLLDPNHPINRLPIPTRLLFDRFLLLAAEWENSIPNSPELVASHTGIPLESCREGIAELVAGRWLSETKTNRRAAKPGKPKTVRELDVKVSESFANPARSSSRSESEARREPMQEPSETASTSRNGDGEVASNPASNPASDFARPRVRVREREKTRAVTSRGTPASAPETNGTAPVEHVREQVIRSLREAAA